MQGRGSKNMKEDKRCEILVSLAESQSFSSFSFETRVVKSHTAVVVCLIVFVVVLLTLSFFRLSYPLHAIVFCSSSSSVN